MRTFLFTLSALLLMATTIARGDAPTTKPADPVLNDITGVSRQPLSLGKYKANVLIFISTECPISNGYAPEMNRLCKAYKDKSIAFYLVHADATLVDAEAKKHAADYGFTCPVLVDRKHELVRQLGATITPEAIVVGPGNAVLYRGRIDDLYVAIGKKRYQATTHDLRDALDAIVAGKPVATPRTEAVGCAISN
jgi:thiol-disulfide isomerase/thioredoxin